MKTNKEDALKPLTLKTCNRCKFWNGHSCQNQDSHKEDRERQLCGGQGRAQNQACSLFENFPEQEITPVKEDDISVEITNSFYKWMQAERSAYFYVSQDESESLEDRMAAKYKSEGIGEALEEYEKYLSENHTEQDYKEVFLPLYKYAKQGISIMVNPDVKNPYDVAIQISCKVDNMTPEELRKLKKDARYLYNKHFREK